MIGFSETICSLKVQRSFRSIKKEKITSSVTDTQAFVTLEQNQDVIQQDDIQKDTTEVTVCKSEEEGKNTTKDYSPGTAGKDEIQQEKSCSDETKADSTESVTAPKNKEVDNSSEADSDAERNNSLKVEECQNDTQQEDSTKNKMKLNITEAITASKPVKVDDIHENIDKIASSTSIEEVENLTNVETTVDNRKNSLTVEQKRIDSKADVMEAVTSPKSESSDAVEQNLDETDDTQQEGSCKGDTQEEITETHIVSKSEIACDSSKDEADLKIDDTPADTTEASNSVEADDSTEAESNKETEADLIETYPKPEGANNSTNDKSLPFESKLSSQVFRSQLIDGSEGIQTIINNLLTLLDQLSKSVGSQQSIRCMKDELQQFQKDSQKITDDADSDCLSEEKASKLNNNLTSVITDVKNYIQESKDLSTKSKASSVSPQEFDELLQNCQGLLSSFDSFEKDDQTHLESSPEEFLSANEAMSASTSFTNQDVEEQKIIVSKEVSHPEINGKVIGGEKNTVTGTTAARRKEHKIQLCFFHILCIIVHLCYN